MTDSTQEPVNPPLDTLDRRCKTLAGLIEDLVEERGEGMPIVAVVGVLEAIKFSLLSNARES